VNSKQNFSDMAPLWADPQSELVIVMTKGIRIRA
jgi:hypothetical protein